MKVVTTEQMRELDRRTIADFGVPGETLMERAGSGIATVVDDLALTCGFEQNPVRMFAGRGNNGGDVFCAARLLSDMEYRVDVWLAGERGKVTGDALRHLEMMRLAGIDVHEATTPDDWEDIMATSVCDEGVIVDGVLGTGIRGPARGAAAGAIQYINALGDTGPVVSVDVPSGLDSDMGEALGDVVCADVTVTMGMPKKGLVMPDALEFVGNVEVVDIGIPFELTDPIMSDLDLITVDELREVMPRRSRTSHKGTYGHLLIIGGAAGYAGAVILAARAAVRSGAGLVSVLAPACIVPAVASAIPEAMIHAGGETDSGSLSGDALSSWSRSIEEFDAIAIGPGLTTHPASRDLVCDILKNLDGPLLLDADALNVIATDLRTVKKCRANVVVTPHPGEMGRMLGISAADVQKARFKTAKEAAKRLGAVVVLKGAGTLVAEEGAPLSVNMTGNPGLARGGMGDVLAGLLGGLLAQGMTSRDAACMAVYLHGRAGDRVAWTSSQAGMSAGDVVDCLPVAYSELTPR
jgi:hydroxyethylthiazole kinase-like uncharacterized protein yjeF